MNGSNNQEDTQAEDIIEVGEDIQISKTDEPSSKVILEDFESENRQDVKLKGKRPAAITFAKNAVQKSQPIVLESSDDDILKAMEAAKKHDQKMAEINAAIRSLKTNLLLSLMLIMTVLILPFLNSTLSIYWYL